MIFAALGFTAHAHHGTSTSNSDFTSVREYAHVLNLSPSQVRDWSKLNKYFEDEFYYVRKDRRLSSRAKTKKLNNLYEQRDRDLRKILSNRQYRKFSNLKAYNSYSRPSSSSYGNGTRYNSYNSNSNYGPTYSCPANNNRRSYRN